MKTKTSRCRYCRREIRWARLLTGRRIPVELDPDDEGIYRLDLSDTENVIHAVRVGEQYRAQLRAEVGLYQHHDDVCPNDAPAIQGAA